MNHGRPKGFSLIELLVVSAIVVVITGSVIAMANVFIQERQRTAMVAEQAREMYMVAKATEDWMVKNSGTWPLNVRQTVTIDALIAGAYLPQQFAYRADATGSVATGVTPFGGRYNVAAIAATLAGKRVHRGVVWETGTPIAWARYARVGLAQGSEPANSSGAASKINAVKLEIARSLQVDHKHPAPAMANVAAASVRGVAGSWTQDVASYIGASSFVVPSVVVLAGWPEYGSVLPPTTPGQNFGVCEVRAANCGPSGDLCGLTTSVPTNGQCFPGETEVKRFPHCGATSQIVSVPQIGSSLTYGQQEITSGSGNTLSLIDRDSCVAERPSDTGWAAYCNQLYSDINANATDVRYDGLVSINNVVVAQYACSQTVYEYTTVFMRPSPYGPMTRTGPNGATDALCCTGP